MKSKTQQLKDSIKIKLEKITYDLKNEFENSEEYLEFQKMLSDNDGIMSVELEAKYFNMFCTYTDKYLEKREDVLTEDERRVEYGGMHPYDISDGKSIMSLGDKMNFTLDWRNYERKL